MLKTACLRVICTLLEQYSSLNLNEISLNFSMVTVSRDITPCSGDPGLIYSGFLRMYKIMIIKPFLTL